MPRDEPPPFGRQRNRTVESLTIGFYEPERPIVERLDRDLALVHQSMVESAEGDEIWKFRSASMGPVLHMMAVDIAPEAAAGEPAALVS